ncbi:MAG: hypothetical protein ACI87E_002851 [Mariniblastus sp.]|jgi:hypothetical protein
MTWLNIAILGVGAALIAVPVILHFLMQPKPKEMIFPAMRFLKERQHTNRSRMRVRHFLLLLMRCLLIALVAMAFAGPSVASADFGNWLTLGGIGLSGLIVGAILLLAFFRQTKNWLLIGILAALLVGHLGYGGWAASKLLGSDSTRLLGNDQAPVAALIVIDTSPRMDYLHDNKTRLEEAKSVGSWLIGQFPVDSQVCVVATDGDSPFFSVDVGAAGRRIQKLKTSFSGASVPDAILDGLQTLSKAPQERKEVYVVSDLTNRSWSGENAKPIIKQLERSVDTNVFLFDVGIQDATNLALTQLELSGAEISRNGRLVVSTEIVRQGEGVQRSIKMTVEKREPPKPVIRDGVALFPDKTFAIQSVTKELEPNGSAAVKFAFSQPLEVGTYHGRVEIEGKDGLAIDDARYFSFRVGQVKKAMIVHPDDVDPRVMESLLAPKTAIEIGTAKFERETLSQDVFNALEDLDDFDVIYLLDPEPMSDEIWQRLESFVQSGGGLGIFLGHNASKDGIAHPSFATPVAARVLSGKLETQWFNEQPDLFLSPRDLSHPVFEAVRGLETDVAWNAFPIYIHWGLEPSADDELPTQTLLRFGNREPAVIERQIGSGRILVMTTPITEGGYSEDRFRWNDLFAGRPLPAWMLLRGMASYLVHGDTRSLNVSIGGVATFDNDPRQFPESYQVFSPAADKPPARLNTVNGKVRFRFIEAPGHYRLKGVMDDEVVMRGFSANISNAVTDLSRVKPDQLDSILGIDRYQLATQKEEIQRQQGTTRRGQEFYPLLVLMMLVVMSVEFLMSNRFYGS